MNKVLIIAEAGVNHNGDLRIAKKLIDVAAEAKVDFVKFQSFKADSLVSKNAKKANYQKVNIGDDDDNQYSMLKKLELSHENHLELMAYCKQKDVCFFSTAFDTDGLDYLNSLGFELFKIPSGEITNYPYLKRLAEIGKPVILSTGMSNMEDIRLALEVLTSESLEISNITVLHCNTEYPTPMGDVNLKAMNTIGKEFNVNIGYSDHTLGIEVPVAAVSLGAKVIEKHFTLNRQFEGPDHLASLEPDELIEMVKSIRNIEMAISGDGVKTPSESEKKNIAIARKSLFTSNPIPKGTFISKADLIPLRPGDGVSPMLINLIIGKKTVRDIEPFTQISLDDFTGLE